MTIRPTACLRLFVALVVAGAAGAPGARAAQGYDSCTGFIDALPATVATPGTWCLRKDLSTAIVGGNAISIASDNVTLDCNDFKLGGLAAGEATAAVGISATQRHNATVRNCNIRGFSTGISIGGGSGHLLEDNRLDNNRHMGISTGNVGVVHVRRNRVLATGGAPENDNHYGIYCDAPSGGACHVDDNTIDGVSGAEGWYSSVFGIRVTRTEGGRVAGNSVRGLVPTGVDTRPYGIYAALSEDGYTTVRDNRMVLGEPVAGSIAIACFGSDTSLAGNTSWGFATATYNCIDDGGNAAH